MNTLVTKEIKEIKSQDYNTLKNLEIHKKAVLKKIRMWKDKLIDEIIAELEIKNKRVGQEIVHIKEDAYYGDKEKIFVIIKDNNIIVKGVYQALISTTIVKTFEETTAKYNLADYSLFGLKKVFDKIYNPLTIEVDLENFNSDLKAEFIILMEEAKTFNINF